MFDESVQKEKIKKRDEELRQKKLSVICRSKIISQELFLDEDFVLAIIGKWVVERSNERVREFLIQEEIKKMLE